MSASPASASSSRSVVGFGRRDRGVLRQGHRHQQLGPVGGREELLLHEAHAVDRGAEGDERGADREPAVPHGEVEHAGEEAHETARFGCACPFMCDGSTATPITGAKRTATNHEATSATAITANSE